MAAALDPLVALDARVLDMEAVEHLLAALDVESLAELRRLVEIGRREDRFCPECGCEGIRTDEPGQRFACLSSWCSRGVQARMGLPPTEPRRSIA